MTQIDADKTNLPSTPPFKGGEGGGLDSFFFDRYARRRFPPSLAWASAAVIVIVIVIGLLWFGYWRPLREFPPDFLFGVAEGATLSETAARLARENLIRSRFWFKAWSTLLGGARGLKAGDYFFEKPLSVAVLARRLTHSVYALEPVNITVPEGLHNREIATRLAEKLVRFNVARFLRDAKEKEGYLFPDTYRFQTNEKPDRVIAVMKENFSRRVKAIEEDLALFGRPLREIIIMASLLEEEARTMETRQKVAGILWKRLDAGMPLQVDGVFPYIFGDAPYDLTDGDLLIDSPYNTYKYAGFPPTPISNPGLDAILAAITPITTPYWYYLSDKDGNMHYAVTHDEHLINRVEYLGK